MNILLWVLQILLALWNLIGGSYMAFHYELIRSDWAAGLPGPVWVAIAVLQVLFALGLVVPGFIKPIRKLIPISAIYLALNSLSGCFLASHYAGFPGMLWGVIPAILAAFIAYGRITLKP
jgi:hypothetical protein